MAFLIGPMTPASPVSSGSMGSSPAGSTSGTGALRGSVTRSRRAPRGRPPPLPGRDAGVRRFGSGRFASGMELRYFAGAGSDRHARERDVPGVSRRVAEQLLDAQQLVVLRDPLA